MDSALLGLVLDSSILIAAECQNVTPEQAIGTVLKKTGEIPIVLCSITIAEIGHGIYRADNDEFGIGEGSF